VDLVAIQAAIGSLKAATDISRSLLQMKTMADVQGKVIELQSALLDAQNGALAATAAQFELLERIRALEAQLKEKGDWEAQRVRYLLVSPWRGPAQAYALKRDVAEGEKPHLVCANCFHSSRRVILNPVSDKGGFVQMVCPACKATMDTGYRGIGGPKYAEEYTAAG
jgi:hypothetical protein